HEPVEPDAFVRVMNRDRLSDVDAVRRDAITGDAAHAQKAAVAGRRVENLRSRRYSIKLARFRGEDGEERSIGARGRNGSFLDRRPRGEAVRLKKVSDPGDARVGLFV